MKFLKNIVQTLLNLYGYILEITLFEKKIHNGKIFNQNYIKVSLFKS